MTSNQAETIRSMYEVLLDAFGPQHWWPAKTREEVIIGAILTQNTAWTNVERAIASLRAADCLTLQAIEATPAHELALLIRASGTYRVKSRRLIGFARWLSDRFDGDLDRLFELGTEQARRELLAVPGIGPETADAILLYAGKLPSFVIDAYTLRILKRHFVIEVGDGYDDARRTMQTAFAPEEKLFGEFHALLVELGKRHCRPSARCRTCPLAPFEHDAELPGAVRRSSLS